MPNEPTAVIPAPETDSTEINIADYRAERAKEQEATPATTPEKTEPVKTAAAPEPAKQESKEEEEADKDTKPKGGFQRRIDALTREKGELERRLAELEATVKNQNKPTVVETAKADGDAKPKQSDFKEYDEYIEALTRWVHRQESKAEADKQAKTAKDADEAEQKQRTKETFDAYANALPTAETKHADFKDVLSNPEMVVPNYVQVAIIEMREQGPEVAYQLAKEFKEKGKESSLAKILELNEAKRFNSAMLELGAFVRSLNPASSPKPAAQPEKPVSTAPTPITPVGGGSGPTTVDDDAIGKMSVSEYRKARLAGKIR